MNHFFSKLAFLALALTCTAGAAPDLSGQKAIQNWYRAWETHDWSLLEQALAGGFTFSSPLDDHIDLQHVKERCWPNTYKIKRFDIEKVVVDGDNVFVVSTGWTTSGKFARNADYFQLKNGKIQAYECFFGPGINYPNSGK
ncbi:MAG TPA: nuclear transport factor 2 family protein [Opitutus sp.]|nr:nuclear transport factor 2 family protein [Opitutus sp.]